MLSHHSTYTAATMSATRLLFACVAAACVLGAAAEEEEEGRSTLLLYKKMDPMEGFAVGRPINVTLAVFNKGLGNAYSLVVSDDNWKPDKFAIVSGGNNFTLDYLNAGDQYVHEFTVVPIKKTWHRVRPARMAFIDGIEGENTIVHTSNNLPDIRIAATKPSDLEEQLLLIGRIVTLNVMQTREGWKQAGMGLLLLLALQVMFVGKAVLQKRRHLRALDEVKKRA